MVSLINLMVIVTAPVCPITSLRSHSNLIFIYFASQRELADILAMYVSNFTSTSHKLPTQSSSSFQRVLHSCLSTRVLLNLREARARETHLPSLNSTPLQHLSFEPTQNSADVAIEVQRRWDDVVLDISSTTLRRGESVDDVIYIGHGDV